MKIAAVYCVYNEDEYLEYSIRSILDFVDRVFILLGEGPYSAYNAQARAQFHRADASEAIVQSLARASGKIRLVKGLWDSELDHRNAGMRLCRKAGMDYYFLVDGDEVYRRDHLENLREEIAAHPDVGQFIIKCDLFWRSFRYRIPSLELNWMPRRLFKITRWSALSKGRFPVPRPVRFTGNNRTNSLGRVYHIEPERVLFYHFSFARTPEKMREKLLTYSHAHEIPPGWYDRVWLRWPEVRGMTNLHPIDPPKFSKVVPRDCADLPEVMRRHPYYNLEIIA